MRISSLARDTRGYAKNEWRQHRDVYRHGHRSILGKRFSDASDLASRKTGNKGVCGIHKFADAQGGNQIAPHRAAMDTLRKFWSRWLRRLAVLVAAQSGALRSHGHILREGHTAVPLLEQNDQAHRDTRRWRWWRCGEQGDRSHARYRWWPKIEKDHSQRVEKNEKWHFFSRFRATIWTRMGSTIRCAFRHVTQRITHALRPQHWCIFEPGETQQRREPDSYPLKRNVCLAPCVLVTNILV